MSMNKMTHKWIGFSFTSLPSLLRKIVAIGICQGPTSRSYNDCPTLSLQRDRSGLNTEGRTADELSRPG